jgi:hypothetical protein
MTLRPVTEAQFQATVVEWATLCGWTHFHTFDSRRSDPGWPDLVLLRPPEIVVAEIKRDGGRLTVEQERTLAALDACGLETHVWRPSDWPAVEARLRRPR